MFTTFLSTQLNVSNKSQVCYRLIKIITLLTHSLSPASKPIFSLISPSFQKSVSLTHVFAKPCYTVY